jgi:phage shock protein A
MSQQVEEAANAKAKALSAVKGARRRLDEANGKVLRLENGAKLAVRADDMETARQAIAAQIDAERNMERCRLELEQAEKAYQSATSVCTQLSANLKELKEKKTKLLKQHRQQQLAKQLQEKYTQSVIEPGSDLLDTIARVETEIEQQEIELEVQSELTKTLGVGFREERVKKLERDAEVDLRLSEIQKQIDKK